MRRVFTNENRFEVDAMRALLESHGIPTMLKNEFTAGIMGEVPFFDTWPEIWVPDDWEAQANHLIDEAEIHSKKAPQADWQCSQCQEDNPGNFELCWNCEASATIFKA